jgi:hypothetical protein
MSRTEAGGATVSRRLWWCWWMWALRELMAASDSNRLEEGDELQHTRFAAAAAAVENVTHRR